MEPEIRLRHGLYVILYTEKVAILQKKSVYILYCTTKKCQFWHFLVVMAWRQGRKQTVSPIDIQLRSIKKIMGASF